MSIHYYEEIDRPFGFRNDSSLDQITIKQRAAWESFNRRVYLVRRDESFAQTSHCRSWKENSEIQYCTINLLAITCFRSHDIFTRNPPCCCLFTTSSSMLSCDSEASNSSIRINNSPDIR